VTVRLERALTVVITLVFAAGYGLVLLAATLLFLTIATPADAEDQPAAWSQGRAVADWTSTGLVAAQIAADGWTSRHEWPHFACRIGLTVGAAELVKHTVPRTRPDGSDRMSFYSEHTALAVVSSGWKFQIGIPIAIGSGYLRMGADRHFASDVAVGALAGVLAMKVCSP
jgi:membrane-associated phospholipid phosphatase